MTPYTLLLTLTAALLHAIWNLTAKRAEGRTTFAFQIALFGIFLWAPAVIWMTWSNSDSAAVNWSLAQWATVLASAVTHAIYAVVLLHGYRVAPLSVVYPVARGTGPLISSLSAILIFSEHVTPEGLLGIFLIVGGVFVLSGQTTKKKASDATRLDISRGVLWGAITGCTIAGYTLVDAYAVKRMDLHPLQYLYYENALRTLLLLPFIRNVGKTLRMGLRQFKAALTVATLGPAGYMLILLAMQLAPVSHIAPAREVSMLFGVFLGGKFLEEGHLKLRLAAAAVIASGVYLLTH